MAESSTNGFDLTTFRLTKILSNNSRAKTICVLGEFPDELIDATGRPAIVLLEKTAFIDANVRTASSTHDDTGDATTVDIDAVATDDESDSKTYFCSQTKLKQEFINDIYGQFQCFPPPDINSKSIFYHILLQKKIVSLLAVSFRVPMLCTIVDP